MSPGVSFQTMWREQEFELPEKEINFCPPAAQFHKWKEELIAGVSQNPTESNINFAKFQLQERYFAFFVSVPKLHQNHIGVRGNHTCLFQVYYQGYQSLHILSLTISPVKIYPPAPPQPAPIALPAPRPIEVAGIFLGEEE